MSNYNFNNNKITGSNNIFGDVINSNINYSHDEKEALAVLLNAINTEKKSELANALNLLSNTSVEKKEKLSAGKLILEMVKGVAQSIGKNSVEVLFNMVTTNVPELTDFSNGLLVT
jgi:methanogenic corrinoid protein MtbC1